MTLTPAGLDPLAAKAEYARAHGISAAKVTPNELAALVALARRALELESALTFLESVQGYESSPHVRLVAYFRRPGEHDASPHPNSVLGLAKILGWPGLQSEGGKGSK